jgi:hypothetical protein
MIIYFADYLIRCEQALQVDGKCLAFKFEVHNKVHVRSFLSSLASIYGIGGFVRRTTTTSVQGKVVSTLGNAENFYSFLEEMRNHLTSSLVQVAKPGFSEKVQDIEVAYAKKFEVHEVPGWLRDAKNPSPDTKDNRHWENVSVVSFRSGGARSW